MIVFYIVRVETVNHFVHAYFNRNGCNHEKFTCRENSKTFVFTERFKILAPYRFIAIVYK